MYKKKKKKERKTRVGDKIQRQSTCLMTKALGSIHSNPPQKRCIYFLERKGQNKITMY
jgi:hypothetical protein